VHDRRLAGGVRLAFGDGLDAQRPIARLARLHRRERWRWQVRG
jgi:hypothetical protein